MFEKITNADERGQIGIGTLIVFIAMVLVAAVAAGVLINTAGLLQSSASDTSDDAQSQVSNQIDVVSKSGVVNSGVVEEVNLVVKKSPGSETVDLTDTTIEYRSNSTSTTLTHAGTTSATEFSTADVAGTASGEILANTSDRAKITLDITSVEDSSDPAVSFGDGNMLEGERVELRLVDQSGATTVVGLNVPDTLTTSQTSTAL